MPFGFGDVESRTLIIIIIDFCRAIYVSQGVCLVICNFDLSEKNEAKINNGE